MYARQRQKGFTLIELLVVIAVISLLLSILTPTLKMAREQAKMVVCSSNLKAIGVGFIMYLAENKDRFHDSPNGGKWDAIGIMTDGSGSLLDAEAPSDVAYWGIAYYKYIENRSAFNCPSAIRPSDWYEPSEHYLYINSCYGLNGYVCKSRITSFHYPEEMIFCQDHLEHRLEDNGDMLYYDPDDNMNMKQLRVEFDPEYPDAEKEVFRHKYQYGGLSLFDNETGMGYCNTLWLDGHVSEIYGGASDFGLDIPYRWYKPTD